MFYKNKNGLRQKAGRAVVGFLTLLLSLAWLSLSLPTYAQSDPIDAADLETFLDGVMAADLEAYNIPGATLSIVHNGEVLLAKGYGYADMEQHTEIDPSVTLFRPGSISKLFTWTAVMQLVEQGKLDLQTDVNEYLDFTIPATYPEPITLAHLMTHTPGFEDRSEGLFVLEEEGLLDLGDYLKAHLPKRVYPPGQVGAYSNYGTALAGYIVERVAEQPFAAYAEQNIFAPLSMDQSTFRQPPPPELADQLSNGYGFFKGAYVRGDFEFVNPYPAGSLSTTAVDMAAFMIAHLQAGRYGDATILQPETVETMHSPQYVADDRLHGITYGFFEEQLNGQRILSHDGDTFLFHSALYLMPDEGFGLYVAYNSTGGTQAREDIFHTLVDRYFPAAPPANVTPPDGAAEQLAAYLGEYHAARSDYSTAAKVLRILESVQVSASPEGYLLLTRSGMIDPYVEIESGLYRHQLRSNLLTFLTDANGTTWLLTSGAAPFAYFKAPWYATLPITMLLIGATLLLTIGSMIGWLIAAFNRGGQPGQRSLLVPSARWIATAFGIILLVFLVGFISIFGDIMPAYGVPAIFFGDVPSFTVIMWVPTVLAIIAAVMVIMAVLAWLTLFTQRRSTWNLAGRLHYTLLAGLAVAVVASLWYWNLLALPG